MAWIENECRREGKKKNLPIQGFSLQVIDPTNELISNVISCFVMGGYHTHVGKGLFLSVTIRNHVFGLYVALPRAAYTIPFRRMGDIFSLTKICNSHKRPSKGDFALK